MIREVMIEELINLNSERELLQNDVNRSKQENDDLDILKYIFGEGADEDGSKFIVFYKDHLDVAVLNYSIHDEVIWVNLIYTTASERKKGYARLLMKHLLETYPSHNFSTTPYNEGARLFFTSLGFTSGFIDMDLLR